jgi:hypothetical protein
MIETASAHDALPDRYIRAVNAHQRKATRSLEPLRALIGNFRAYRRNGAHA